jgi:hypothetical protein
VRSARARPDVDGLDRLSYLQQETICFQILNDDLAIRPRDDEEVSPAAGAPTLVDLRNHPIGEAEHDARLILALVPCLKSIGFRGHRMRRPQEMEEKVNAVASRLVQRSTAGL